MPKYHRVLVKYRLPNSTEWSDFHWCDIERTADMGLTVSVAKASSNGAMPPDTAFTKLEFESAKKLLVLDCSQHPQSTEHARYGVILADNNMFRVPFQPMSRLFAQQGGQAWVEDNIFDGTNRLQLQCFTAAEITQDNRLRMRSHNPADNYELLACEIEEVAQYQQQYRAWETTRPQTREPVVVAVQSVKVVPQRDNEQSASPKQDLDWVRQRRTPIDIALHSVPSGLETTDRILCHYAICDELTRMKQATSTQEEYQRVLYILVSNTVIPTDFSKKLSDQIRLFRNILLRDSDDLNTMFSQEGSSHPCLYMVYQYVLELVFLELKIQDISLIHATSDMYVAGCPDSYVQIHLGRVRPRTEVLMLPTADTEDDEAFARVLNDQEQRGFGQLSQQTGRRYRLFGPAPDHAPPSGPAAFFGMLVGVIGAGLCALGVSIALSSSLFTGAAIFSAGLCCLLLVALMNTNTPTPNYVPTASAFGYPMGGFGR